MEKETWKTLVIVVLAIALVALFAGISRTRKAQDPQPMQAAPLCAPCRCDCPVLPACTTATAPEKADPAQPPIPPSLVLRLARQGKDCTLSGEPDITILKGD